MKTSYLLLGMAVMAGVTYLIRLIPMALIRKKIQNKWIQSFLYYVPYVVLSAMTFPAVFESTGSLVSAIVGCVIAILLAIWGKSLLIVAVGAALGAFIMRLIGL